MAGKSHLGVYVAFYVVKMEFVSLPIRIWLIASITMYFLN